MAEKKSVRPNAGPGSGIFEFQRRASYQGWRRVTSNFRWKSLGGWRFSNVANSFSSTATSHRPTRYNQRPIHYPSNMRFISSRAGLVLFALAALTAISIAGQSRGRAGVSSRIPTSILLQIIRAEDERRWDDQLDSLLSDKDAQIRTRAALAAGRIGDERAISPLVRLLRDDADANVRQMTAFAIGEIESPLGAEPLLEVLGYRTATRRGNERVDGSSGGVRASDGDEARARPIEANGAVARPLGRASEVTSDVRARAVEALGKIAAALPDSDKDRRRIYGEAILKALRFEDQRRSRPDHLTILLGLTATLRAKPDGAGPVIARFVSYADSRIVADALNALARLRLKDGNDLARELLAKSFDPIVRANAARVLGATEDRQAFDALLDRALHDSDLRVRVSAIRALGNLKEVRAAAILSTRVIRFLANAYKDKKHKVWLRQHVIWLEQTEALEVVATLGNIFAAQGGDYEEKTLNPLTQIDSPRGAIFHLAQSWRTAPETSIAAAKTNPADYLSIPQVNPFTRADAQFPRTFFSDWRHSAYEARGLGTIASLNNKEYGSGIYELKATAQKILLKLLKERNLSEVALSDVLTAYAAFNPEGLDGLLREYLIHPDVIVRSTAAELLGNQTPTDANVKGLASALKSELPRVERAEMNDAALAILEALAKQKNDEANAAIKTALDSSDHLIRRKAVALLKANGGGDFSNRIGTVKTRNTEADYRRAIARIGKQVTATVETSKGSFVIELLPEDAPLTVDNFIQLAKRGFFNGQTIPRVVANFVIQAGDPRGDTNGGPGYQIRCEINELPYERGTAGMALSGKDTGGSQWFVTHSPQPHLDGGYTVFGHVIRGMEVVDNIARGDVIRRVIVSER
jgi:cyclophilin family peptidyl-prolyl cis-trans isomerase/HEAT repeat protein